MKLYVLAAALMLTTSPLLAQSTSEAVNRSDAARAAVEATASALDTDDDGFISRVDIMGAAAEAFPIYDANNSNHIDALEFRTSPFGFGEMAKQRGREQAYNAALGLVFDIFDRAGDGLLSQDDFLAAINRAFSYADIDYDDQLSRQEFFRGFITNVALRHAMREDT